MLNYNSTDPEHIKARQNVVPPSVDEIKEAVAFMEQVIVSAVFNENFNDAMVSDIRRKAEVLQRLIYEYENKSHFHDVVGGWDGLNKLKGNTNVQCNKCKGCDLTNDATLTCNPPIKHYVCNCCGNTQIEK